MLAQGNKGPLGVDLKPQQCYNITCLGGPGGGRCGRAGACAGATPTCTLTVTRDTALSATFEP